MEGARRMSFICLHRMFFFLRREMLYIRKPLYIKDLIQASHRQKIIPFQTLFWFFILRGKIPRWYNLFRFSAENIPAKRKPCTCPLYREDFFSDLLLKGVISPRALSSREWNIKIIYMVFCRNLVFVRKISVYGWSKKALR